MPNGKMFSYLLLLRVIFNGTTYIPRVPFNPRTNNKIVIIIYDDNNDDETSFK